MASVRIGGKKFMDGTDKEVEAFRQTIDRAMHSGGAWVTGQRVAMWVGPGIPVAVEYDGQGPVSADVRPWRGPERIV